MILVAFPAVHRSVSGWLEGYFGLLPAVRTSCFMHLSWTARSETASASAEAASSIVAHLYFSFGLVYFIFFSKGHKIDFHTTHLNLTVMSSLTS